MNFTFNTLELTKDLAELYVRDRIGWNEYLTLLEVVVARKPERA